jgi:ribosomal protein S18 acetylase RimI-like enzyme
MDDDYASRIAAGEATVAVDADGERIVAVLVTERHGDHLLIDNVAVSPAAQGRGLGAALLAEAARQAQGLGLPLLRLYTHAMMVSSIALYRRAGFTEIARLTEKGFDRVYMQKTLPAAGRR